MPERARLVASAVQRAAAVAAAQGEVWARHRSVSGCVTVGGERVSEGFVVAVPERHDLASRIFDLEGGCYALRLARDFGRGTLMTVLREPATGWFLDEIAPEAARVDVALPLDEFVPVEVELIVHRWVTRERLQLHVSAGRDLDTRRIAGRQDPTLGTAFWNTQRDIFPVPSPTTVQVQRGKFTVYVTSLYNESDRHYGIEQSAMYALRVGDGPWILEPPMSETSIEFDTSTERHLTLFVCCFNGPECDELPPWSPPGSVECPPGTVAWARSTSEGIEATCRDEQQRVHGPALQTHDEGGGALGTYEHGTKHGRWTTWSSEGRTLSVREYAHDIAHGEHRFFFAEDPSQLRAVERYEHGQRHGRWATWHQNGRTATESFFRQGEARGRWFQQSSGGTLLFESSFGAEGNGPFTEYFDSGSPRVSGQYIDGVQAGAWTWFDEHTGEVVQRCLVEDGRSVECSLEPEARRLELPL